MKMVKNKKVRIVWLICGIILFLFASFAGLVAYKIKTKTCCECEKKEISSLKEEGTVFVQELSQGAKGVASDPEADKIYKKAVTLFHRGDKDEAETIFKELLEKKPKFRGYSGDYEIAKYFSEKNDERRWTFSPIYFWEFTKFLERELSDGSLKSFAKLSEEKRLEKIARIETALRVRCSFDKKAVFPEISSIEEKVHQERMQNPVTLKKLLNMMLLKEESEFSSPYTKDIFRLTRAKILVALSEFEDAERIISEYEDDLTKLISSLYPYSSSFNFNSGPLYGELIKTVALKGLLLCLNKKYAEATHSIEKLANLIKNDYPDVLLVQLLRAKLLEMDGKIRVAKKIKNEVIDQVKELPEEVNSSSSPCCPGESVEVSQEYEEVNILLADWATKNKDKIRLKFKGVHDFEDYEGVTSHPIFTYTAGILMLEGGKEKLGNNLIKISLLQLFSAFYPEYS